MREWAKEDLDAIRSAIRVVMKRHGLDYWYRGIDEEVMKEVSPRYRARPAVENNGILVSSGLPVRVWDTKAKCDVAWCSTASLANKIAELLNQESEEVC